MNYEDPTYYILNKQEDFNKGICINLDITDDTIKVKESLKGTGIFISDFYDSYEIKTIWNRMVMNTKGDGIVKITYYCSDDIENVKENLNRHMLPSEMDALMEKYKVKSVVNAFDILIHDAVGRFFWFKVEILDLKEKKTFITDIRIEFSIQSFLRYLPEIYQEDEESRKFLEGYLGIFQSIYMDMEKKIDKVSSYFDPDVTSPEVLEWLCNWVKIENSYIWSEEKLRYLLKNAVKLYEKIGTVEGISEIVELYASEKPYIIEYFHYKNYLKYKEQYEILTKLYSDNPYEFVVLLSEKSIPSEKEYKEVYKIINEFKPAHTEFKLVILKSYIFLGGYSYLGINSYINSDKVISLDGASTIPFVKIEL